MKRRTLAALSIAAALIVPARADAHLSLHPNTVPAGALATLDLRVPGEQEGAHVTKVAVRFPKGLSSVDYEPIPGWSARVLEAKLATPILEDGEKIDTAVTEIVWSWKGPAGELGDGQFIDFPLSLAVPEDAAGRSLEFRAVQSYSDGHTVHWIDPSLEAEHPSPRINVTTKGGAIEDLAGTEAGPLPGQTAAPTPSSGTVAGASSGASKGLALAALIVGALGLIAGLLALLGSRRGKASW